MCRRHVPQLDFLDLRIFNDDWIYDPFRVPNILSQEPKKHREHINRLSYGSCIFNGIFGWSSYQHVCSSSAWIIDPGSPLFSRYFRVIFSSVTLLKKEILPVPRRNNFDYDPMYDDVQTSGMAVWRKFNVWSWLLDVWPLYNLLMDHIRHLSDCRVVWSWLQECCWPYTHSFYWPVWPVHKNSSYFEWDGRKQKEEEELTPMILWHTVYQTIKGIGLNEGTRIDTYSSGDI